MHQSVSVLHPHMLVYVMAWRERKTFCMNLKCFMFSREEMVKEIFMCGQQAMGDIMVIAVGQMDMCLTGKFCSTYVILCPLVTSFTKQLTSSVAEWLERSLRVWEACMGSIPGRVKPNISNW